MFQKTQSTKPKLFIIFILVSFVTTLVMPPNGYAQVAGLNQPSFLNLPAPGVMVTSTQAFDPAKLLGMNLYPDNPLLFDFIVGHGDSGLEGDAFKQESKKLIEYFLAALTIPQKELWVNLSPYENNRILPKALGQTALGRDMLAQDYMLKQLASSIMHPDEPIGQEFWQRVYKKAYDMFGTTEIPISTYNKVWIIPESMDIYEHDIGVFIVDSKLKVMLEEDYLALEANQGHTDHGLGTKTLADMDSYSGVSSQIVREVLIPEIEREVNEGQIFANLRQMMSAIILASWYKDTLKESVLTKIYADQEKVNGVTIEDETVIQDIYERYVQAFKTGVYDFIREEYDENLDETLPRKYFSGGVRPGQKPENTTVRKPGGSGTMPGKTLKQTASLVQGRMTGLAMMTDGEQDASDQVFGNGAIAGLPGMGAGFAHRRFKQQQGQGGQTQDQQRASRRASTVAEAARHFAKIVQDQKVLIEAETDQIIKSITKPEAESGKTTPGFSVIAIPLVEKVLNESWDGAEALAEIVRLKNLGAANSEAETMPTTLTPNQTAFEETTRAFKRVATQQGVLSEENADLVIRHIRSGQTIMEAFDATKNPVLEKIMSKSFALTELLGQFIVALNDAHLAEKAFTKTAEQEGTLSSSRLSILVEDIRKHRTDPKRSFSLTAAPLVEKVLQESMLAGELLGRIITNLKKADQIAETFTKTALDSSILSEDEVNFILGSFQTSRIESNVFPKEISPLVGKILKESFEATELLGRLIAIQHFKPGQKGDERPQAQQLAAATAQNDAQKDAELKEKEFRTIALGFYQKSLVEAVIKEIRDGVRGEQALSLKFLSQELQNASTPGLETRKMILEKLSAFIAAANSLKTAQQDVEAADLSAEPKVEQSINAIAEKNVLTAATRKLNSAIDIFRTAVGDTVAGGMKTGEAIEQITSGKVVTQGDALGLVTGTGEDTENDQGNINTAVLNLLQAAQDVHVAQAALTERQTQVETQQAEDQAKAVEDAERVAKEATDAAEVLDRAAEETKIQTSLGDNTLGAAENKSITEAGKAVDAALEEYTAAKTALYAALSNGKNTPSRAGTPINEIVSNVENHVIGPESITATIGAMTVHDDDQDQKVDLAETLAQSWTSLEDSITNLAEKTAIEIDLDAGLAAVLDGLGVGDETAVKANATPEEQVTAKAKALEEAEQTVQRATQKYETAERAAGEIQEIYDRTAADDNADPNQVEEMGQELNKANLALEAAQTRLKKAVDARDALKDKGGIDFNDENMMKNIQRNGDGVIIPQFAEPINLDNIEIEGFSPVILNVAPITNLPLILGMETGEAGDTGTGPVDESGPQILSYYRDPMDKIQVKDNS